MNAGPYNVSVRHKVLKSGSKIRSRRFHEGGYEHYKIRLFVSGRDVGALESVEYLLHDTFANPRRIVTDPANGFALDIWTWGEFEIRVTLNFKDGAETKLIYPLAYSSELPSSDSAYTNEGPGSRGIS